REVGGGQPVPAKMWEGSPPGPQVGSATHSRSKGSTVKRTSARLAAMAESATLAVDAKAKALKAKGENVIGFGAGEPDFPTPDNIVEAAARACHAARYPKDTHAAGLPELREAIAVKTMRDS